MTRVERIQIPDGNVWNQGNDHFQLNDCVIRVYDDHMLCRLAIVTERELLGLCQWHLLLEWCFHDPKQRERSCFYI